MIQEDHYQIISTLDAVCENRKDLTDETKIILEILRSNNSIEESIHIISRKLDLMNKLISKIIKSPLESEHFATRFLRNLDPHN